MTRAGALALTALVLAGCASGETSLKLPSLGLGSEKRPLVADLKPGPYEASRLAIGEAKDLAQQRGEGVGFVPSSPLSAYLNRIRVKLLTGSGVTRVPGRVVILANPGFVAYSTPDGNVYVAMAWLPVLTNEDEVAAIIAHELSHVLLTHHSSDVLVGVRKRAQSMHELGLTAKAAVDKSPAAAKSDQKALTISHLVSEVSDKMAMPRRTKKTFHIPTWRVAGPEPCASTIAGCRPFVVGTSNSPRRTTSPLRISIDSVLWGAMRPAMRLWTPSPLQRIAMIFPR